MMMAQTAAQKKAQQKYNAKHKEQRKLMSYRNTARVFIRSYATDDDLAELQTLMMSRSLVNRERAQLPTVEAYMTAHDLADKLIIWGRPEDLLTARQADDDTTDWQAWFDETIAPHFNRDEPVIEFKTTGQSKYYSCSQAIAILDWQDQGASS
ncbi:hypothetical protein [Secundilactobacillus paracollinoides]|uniref:hypothetical protein n=1 Tax=Secundilactobacillus paracollinoides TaxID=240427 RepID=UPI0006F1B8E1|nr:hypothetical protein [Secundilactobacillus paracollinoides]KRL81565.1 hypothetical protein FC17_GL001707 [Secundilactobacillus paracollinoides DSM 15502 = JCM 11969]